MRETEATWDRLAPRAVVRRVLTLAVFSICLAVPAAALPENPFERSGSTPATPTDVGPDGSSVGIFSGNLSLQLPLHSLPVGGNVSMSLAASYSSKSLWRLQTHGSQWDDAFEFIGAKEMGAGWEMTAGRVVNRWVGELATTVQYLYTPDGTPHRLYRLGGSTGPNNQFITRDGTFLRALWTEDNTYKVFVPDGTIFEYGHRNSDQQDFEGLSYYLSTVVDVSGNRVTLQYHDSPHGNVVKSLTDSHGRSITTTLIPESDPQLRLRGLVATVACDGFGGAPAIVSFNYEVRSIRTPPVYSGTTPYIDMALLVRITRPEPGIVETFDYNAFGELSRHVLPTGAATVFQHSTYFLTPPGRALGRGVENRYVYLDGNSANVAPENQFQWTFWRVPGTNAGCPTPPNNWLVRVRNPENTWTFYTFARRPGEGTVPTTELLSSEVVYAPATPNLDPCFNPPPGTAPYRTTTFKWQIDDFPDSIIDQNPRLVETKVVVHDNNSGNRVDHCG